MPLSQHHQTPEGTERCWAGAGADRSHHWLAWGQLTTTRLARGHATAWCTSVEMEGLHSPSPLPPQQHHRTGDPI